MRHPEQLPLDLPHRASSDREDLLVGASNRLAVEAIDAWPSWRHPILLVAGPAGSGKTHLLEAWCRTAGAARFGPSSTVGGGSGFAVAVDDVERRGFDEAQLFALLNAARLGGGTVLATSRVRPAAMETMLPDLRSRLGAATVVELGPPDDALLSGVLVKLFSDRQLAVDPRLVQMAVDRMERSVEAARELVARIDREALATKRKVSRGLLHQVMMEMEEETRR